MRASVLFSVGKIKPYSRTAPQFPPFFLQLVATPPIFRDKSPNAFQNCRKTKEEEALWLPPPCMIVWLSFKPIPSGGVGGGFYILIFTLFEPTFTMAISPLWRLVEIEA